MSIEKPSFDVPEIESEAGSITDSIAEGGDSIQEQVTDSIPKTEMGDAVEAIESEVPNETELGKEIDVIEEDINEQESFIENAEEEGGEQAGNEPEQIQTTESEINPEKSLVLYADSRLDHIKSELRSRTLNLEYFESADTLALNPNDIDARIGFLRSSEELGKEYENRNKLAKEQSRIFIHILEGEDGAKHYEAARHAADEKVESFLAQNQELAGLMKGKMESMQAVQEKVEVLNKATERFGELVAELNEIYEKMNELIKRNRELEERDEELRSEAEKLMKSNKPEDTEALKRNNDNRKEILHDKELLAEEFALVQNELDELMDKFQQVSGLIGSLEDESTELPAIEEEAGSIDMSPQIEAEAGSSDGPPQIEAVAGQSDGPPQIEAEAGHPDD